MQPHSRSAGQPASSSRTFFEYLAVRAGDQWFAVDVQAANEIRGPETFDRPISEGRTTLTVRENALKVVDLRRLSGLSAFAYTCPAMLLVQAAADTLALAVDEVGEIESVPRERVRAANPLGYVFCSHSIALGANGEIPLIDPMLLIAA
ncbi:chemotaxis protein CheW [Stenotrophomonas sp.]|uniref:chemotaxis protein CheW n=1 Tax=Stenotrophomonas sp. TaxID=69392 RepID=UPI002D749FFD|nr:chemotaxis protein CheW [Stenotrophomonas sp.]HYQ23518.1 chemotaxis protein CheW [Stenotrophomonas sp.]